MDAKRSTYLSISPTSMINNDNGFIDNTNKYNCNDTQSSSSVYSADGFKFTKTKQAIMTICNCPLGTAYSTALSALTRTLKKRTNLCFHVSDKSLCSEDSCGILLEYPRRSNKRKKEAPESTRLFIIVIVVTIAFLVSNGSHERSIINFSVVAFQQQLHIKHWDHHHLHFRSRTTSQSAVHNNYYLTRYQHGLTPFSFSTMGKNRKIHTTTMKNSLNGSSSDKSNYDCQRESSSFEESKMSTLQQQRSPSYSTATTTTEPMSITIKYLADYETIYDWNNDLKQSLKTILSRRDNVNEMHNNITGISNDHYYATELIYLAMEAEEVMLSSFVTSTSSAIGMNEDDENDELHSPQLLQPNIESVNLILEVWSNAIQTICNHNKSSSSPSSSSTSSATAAATSPPMFAALVKNKRITVQKAVETAEALLFQLEQSSSNIKSYGHGDDDDDDEDDDELPSFIPSYNTISDKSTKPSLPSDLSPNKRSYNAILQIYADSSHLLSGAAERAEQLCQRMSFRKIPLTTDSYHNMIVSWSHSSFCLKGQQALRLLEQMKHHKQLQQQKTQRSQRQKPKRKGLQRQKKGRIRVETRTYNAVFRALLSNDLLEKEEYYETAVLIEEMMEEMLNQYFSHEKLINDGYNDNFDNIKPTMETYQMVMNAWNKVDYHTCRTILYNKKFLDNDWISSDNTHTMPAPSTERVLKRIKEVYHQTGQKDADLKPTLSQYASVINTWTKCSRYELKAAPRTEQFLHELEQLSITDDVYKPTVEIYTTVIKAYTYSKHAQKPQLALRILQDMETRYKQTKGEGIRPTLRTYHGVMNACAMCTHTGDQKDRTEALRIAFQLLKVMRASGVHKPNFVTYGTLIKATKNLVPPSETQDQIFRNVFAQCKRDGQVEGVILNQLRSWTSDPLFRELTERVPIRIGKRYYKNPNSNSAELRNRGGYDGGNNSDNGGNNGWEDVMKDIPTEWKRNVLPLKE